MPEVVTKHPEIVLQVLEAGGARCGPGQTPEILTECPEARFCSTPGGETCVYGLDEIEEMTQITRADLAERVCAGEQAAAVRSDSGGCAFSAGPPPGAALAACAAALAWLTIRARTRSPR